MNAIQDLLSIRRSLQYGRYAKCLPATLTMLYRAVSKSATSLSQRFTSHGKSGKGSYAGQEALSGHLLQGLLLEVSQQLVPRCRRWNT